MHNVYVLKSLKSGKRYTGITSQTLAAKLKEHNLKATTWTSYNGPFELVYFEKFEDSTRARKRELFFKTGNGRRVLDNLISKR